MFIYQKLNKSASTSKELLLSFRSFQFKESTESGQNFPSHKEGNNFRVIPQGSPVLLYISIKDKDSEIEQALRGLQMIPGRIVGCCSRRRGSQHTNGRNGEPQEVSPEEATKILTELENLCGGAVDTEHVQPGEEKALVRPYIATYFLKEVTTELEKDFPQWH